MSRKRNMRMFARQMRQGGPASRFERAANVLGIISHMAARQSAEPLSADQRRDLALAHHGALRAIQMGRATEQEVADLVNAANIAQALAARGLGQDWVDTITAGQQALAAIGQRQERHPGRWVATGPELQALAAMVELHDAQLESDDCTEGLVMAAIDDTHKRIAAGHVHQAAAA